MYRTSEIASTILRSVVIGAISVLLAWLGIEYGGILLPPRFSLYLQGISGTPLLAWLFLGTFCLSFSLSAYRRNFRVKLGNRYEQVLSEIPGRRKVLMCLGVLLLTHVWIYRDMYFGDAGFGLDFTRTYYAVPYYWMSSLRSGHGIPYWVPHQAMGYPLLLNVQSGVFYAPFYFFVLTGIPYTYHAAVIFQCLHIFLGTVGALFFFRRWGYSYGTCLLGAIAYGFFGGFFSNGQHADIIRGYALIPWFLLAICLQAAPARRVLHTLLLPLTTYLLFTGTYPGLSLATLFLGLLFSASLALQKRGAGAFFSSVRLSVLGVMLAAGQLLPSYLLRNEVQRQQTFQAVQKTFFTAHHFFTTALPYQSDRLSGDLSMRSLFIGLPLCLLLFFVARKDWNRFWPHAALLAVAILMITGSPLYNLITRMASPLSLSRFPAADYRGISAIFLIGFGLAGFEHIAEGVPRRTILRQGLFVGLLVAGVLDLRLSHNVGLLGPLFLSLVACIGLPFVASKFVGSARLILCFFVGILLLLDGTRVTGFEPPYKVEHAEATYQRLYGAPPPSSWSSAAFNLLHGPRPARKSVAGIEQYSWEGYLDGSFMMGDYAAGIQFHRAIEVLADPQQSAFMAQPSTGIILPLSATSDPNALKSSLKLPSRARTMEYGQSSETIDVNLAAPALLLENEMYYPGWHGTINAAEVKSVDALDVLGHFRAYKLPAGKYLFRETFSMPYLTPALGTVIGAMLAWSTWLILVIASTRRRRGA